MDGNTSVKYECTVFDKGHVMQFDPSASGADKSVYTCACGASHTEHEDAGTGA